MSSKTKMIGDIGEAVLTAEFLKHNIPVFKPVGDNLPYDLLVFINGKYKRIQVKTTENIVNGTMIFQTNITNPFKKTRRKYTTEEVDIFGLYCLENNFVGLLKIEDCSSTDTIIRVNPAKNNQTKRVRYKDNYAFDKMLLSIDV